MIKVHSKCDEDDEDRDDDDRARGGCHEGIIPKLDPTEYGNLDEEEKETKDRRKRPREFDEPTHSLVR